MLSPGAAPPVDPHTHCESCGTAIDGPAARYCGICGGQLLRPDLRALRGRPAPPDGASASVPPAQAPPMQAPQAIYVMAPARAGSSPGTVAAIVAGIVLLLAGVAVTIVLASSSGDADDTRVIDPAQSPATVQAVP